MRRNRKSNIRKERIIMFTSSAFVLAALTMTGMYMKEQNVESKDDGYTLDFTALEENVDDKYEEIAQNDSVGEQLAQNDMEYARNFEVQQEVTEDDLDYMPMEVGSGQVEIPGLTDSMEQLDMESEALLSEEMLEKEGMTEEEQPKEDEAAAAQTVIVESPAFVEENGLAMPVSGEILMHYSMDSSIYFATLDQYKYNPAVMISAPEGTLVNACAGGKVIDVFDDSQIGKAVVLDLGNGYQATYGQMGNIEVTVGSYVEEGDAIGVVAAPTKYYSVEGSNLYFMLTRDGEAINPEGMFR